MAFEFAPTGMIVLSLEGRILEANPAYCAITGYTEEELRTMQVQDLTYAEDLPPYLNLLQQLMRAEISCFQFEKRYLTKGGKVLWDQHRVSMTAAQNLQGKTVCLVALIQDISERKQIERERSRLASVVERANDFIGICDLDLRVMFVNPAGQKLVGLTSLQEAQALPVADYFFPEDARRYTQEVLPTVLKGGTWSGEFRFRHFQTGEAIPVAVYDVFSIHHPETHEPTHFVHMSRDLRERKRVEQELRALAARLQCVREEERTQVAREIHDELGQALTAIKLDFVSLLRNLPPEQAKSSKAESILQLVNNTLTSVRRIATELRPGILDDLGLVAAVEWAAEEWAARTETKLHLDLPPDDIAVDREHATALFRIFQETLTNIARHAHATTVDVQLTHKDGNLFLQVQDNGQGISPEQVSSGKSLGMVGMRERALLLGGEWAIHSAPREGTTVKVRLPAHSASSPE